MLGPPTSLLGQSFLGTALLGLPEPGGQSSPQPIAGKASILNTTTRTIAGKSYVFKGQSITGKASISNPYYPGSFSWGYNDNVQIKLTATASPVSASITFTSASKKSRGGAGIMGALSTKRSAGGESWNINYLARKTLNNQSTIASRAFVKTIALT